MMSLSQLVLLGLMALLFDTALLRMHLWPVLLLGTLGLATSGTLFGGLTATTSVRGTLLPVLLLPLTLPVLVAAVQATSGLLAGQTLAQVHRWLRLLVVYDLVMIALGMLTFEQTLQE